MPDFSTCPADDNNKEEEEYTGAVSALPSNPKMWLRCYQGTWVLELSKWFYDTSTGTALREQPAVVLLFRVGSDHTRCWL
jgi:hypothetical protein